jgi:hypothetical protein
LFLFCWAAAVAATEATADAASAKGTDAGSVSLDCRLNGEFNRRWQLLSAIIDHVCRSAVFDAFFLVLHVHGTLNRVLWFMFMGPCT